MKKQLVELKFFEIFVPFTSEMIFIQNKSCSLALSKRIPFVCVFLCFGIGLSLVSGEEDVVVRLKSSAWFQVGRIMHSSDTLKPDNNYNGNWLQSPGAQFTVEADIGESMQGAMGLGGFQTQSQVGTIIKSKDQKLGFERYITEARLSYFLFDRENPFLKFDVGLFSFNYNRNIKNLGLYLFRGPVYPGTLISEFESKTIDTTVANIRGFHVQNNLGLFSHDLILRSESEFKGNFDWSVAYLGKLSFGEVFEIGGGVNFYRLLPSNPDFTNLTDSSAYHTLFRRDGYRSDKTPAEYLYQYIHADTLYESDSVTIDTTLYDTTRLSHQGIKLMAQASFDPKPLFSSEVFGPHDLKFYMEAAVIGTKNYRGIYADINQRIPVVFGFNFPTFGLLDFLSLEIEYYKSPYRNDYGNLVDGDFTSPAPVSNTGGDYNRMRDPNNPALLSSDSTLFFADFDVENMTSDDLKWSLYLRKTIMGNAVISAQIANDHYRPAQYDTKAGRYETAFTRVEDWYWMLKVGYLF